MGFWISRSPNWGMPSGSLYSDMRSPEALYLAVMRARQILENAGIDLDKSYVTPGNTIQDKTDYLEMDIERLNEVIAVERARLDALLMDRDWQAQRIIMVSAQAIENHRQELKAYISDLKNSGRTIGERLSTFVK